MSAKRRDADYLSHMLDAIARIESYLAGKDEAQFLEDSMLRDAVIRNRLIHGYFSVDLRVVWDTITFGLPKLREQLEAISKLA